MDPQEILDSLAAGHQGGIVTAGAYLSSWSECMADDVCVRRFLGGNEKSPANLAAWQKAVEESQSQLTYSDDNMRVLGTYDLKTGAKHGRFHKRRRDKQPSSVLEFDCVLTSSKQDRDRDILESQGARVDPKMPLLWQHMPYMPIGKLIEVLSQNSKRVVCSFSVADTELGNDAASLIEFGALRISHGFRPKKFEPLEKKKDDPLPSGWRVLEFDVYEGSVVSIPANTDAVITAFSRGKLHAPLVKEWASRVKSGATRSVPVSLPGHPGVTIPVTLEVRTIHQKGDSSSCGCGGKSSMAHDHQPDDQGVEIKEADGGKPYPNEHSCRMKDPADFQANSFRRVTRKHDGKEYAVIMGKPKGSDSMAEQAYRYPKANWTAAAAKAHCGNHGGKFEAASEADANPDHVKGKLSREHHKSLAEAADHVQAAMDYDGVPSTAKTLLAHAHGVVTDIAARNAPTRAAEGEDKSLSKRDTNLLADAADHVAAGRDCPGMPGAASTLAGKAHEKISAVATAHRHSAGGSGDLSDGVASLQDFLATRLIGALLTGKAVHPGILSELKHTIDEAYQAARNQSLENFLR